MDERISKGVQKTTVYTSNYSAPLVSTDGYTYQQRRGGGVWWRGKKDEQQ